jgi:hypothetical protein
MEMSPAHNAPHSGAYITRGIFPTTRCRTKQDNRERNSMGVKTSLSRPLTMAQSQNTNVELPEMRTAWCIVRRGPPPKALRKQEIPMPTLDDNQVLIKVQAAALNPVSALKACSCIDLTTHSSLLVELTR